MSDYLDFLWPHIEYSDPVFSEPYEPWARAAFTKLKSAGILQQGESADTIACPDCEYGHVERIVKLDYPVNGYRHAIPCPEHGRVLISPVEIMQWGVSFQRLVDLLVAALNLNGRVTEVEPRRLWRLVGRTWQPSPRASS